MTPRRFWPLLLIVAIACGIVGIANPGPVAGAPPAQTAPGVQDLGALNPNAIEVQPLVRLAKGGAPPPPPPNACTPTTCAAQGKNCTLTQTCSTGCLTGVNDTPVTANIGFATPVASDTCFADTAPLTLSTNATIGGSYVTLTATLTQPHLSAFVNFEGATLDVPPLCGNLIPLTIAPGATSVSWVQPTNVVTTPTTVPLNVLISYIEAASGRLRNLVSVSSPLTLNPGGTLPTPPLVSFSVTNAGGTPISTIPGGTNAFAIGTLPAATPAPVGGTRGTGA